jgi:hypothetical protein
MSLLQSASLRVIAMPDVELICSMRAKRGFVRSNLPGIYQEARCLLIFTARTAEANAP